MSINHFDQACRYSAKLDAVAFLAWLFDQPAETFAFRGWLDTRGLPFPGTPDRVSDTVAHLEVQAQHGVPWAIAIEFQSLPDPLMFGRLLAYIAGLWLDHKPDLERGSRFHVGAAVVNLTGTGSTSRDMNWFDCRLQTQLQVVERNLEYESAMDLLAGIESGKWSRVLLPWIPLLMGGGRSDTIDRWIQFAEAEPNLQRKAEYAGLALVFADKAGCLDLWQRKLEGWNVEESTIVNSWITKAETRAEARGELHGTQSAIMRLGAKKFGLVTDSIAATVHAISDHARLERIIDRILVASDWDDLLATP